QPGHYEVIGRQHVFGGPTKRAVAADHINICPATSRAFSYYVDGIFYYDFNVARTPRGEIIDWGHERGGRYGSYGGVSPERTDPPWISIWDEQPVAVYGTVDPTGSDLGPVSGMGFEANNQPAIVTDKDWPATHFGHDVNVMLV